MHSPDRSIQQRMQYAFTFLVFFTALIASYTNKAYATVHPKQDTILVLGDSLSAAYGIPIQKGWVALLERELDDRRLINASISGETTDGGLRALPQLLSKHTPSLVIIELGANDGLRGFPIPTIAKHLEEMILLCKANNAEVLLVGMHIPPNYGKRYANAFHAIYGELAEKHNTGLVPFLLDKVAIHPHLMQEDRLHPKAEAQETIKNTVWQQLSHLLNK